MNTNIKIGLYNPTNWFKCGIISLFNELNLNDIKIFNEINSKNILSVDVLILEQEKAPVEFIKKINLLKDKNLKPNVIVIIESYNREMIINYLQNQVKGLISVNYNDINPAFVVNFVNNGNLIIDKNICNFLETNDYVKITDKKISRAEFKENHANLTQREYEVLKLVVDGKSNYDIAQELTISEHTAKAHVCNIIQKLVVDDRTQAAVKALKDGLVPID